MPGTVFHSTSSPSRLLVWLCKQGVGDVAVVGDAHLEGHHATGRGVLTGLSSVGPSKSACRGIR